MKHKRQHTRQEKEKGQSLVEMALVLPIMLIILAGVLEVGRLYYVYVAVSDAAGEGANYAAVFPDPAHRTELTQRVQEASGGLVVIDPSLIQVDCPNVASGNPVTVTVGYTFTVAAPFAHIFIPDGEIILNATATGAILSGTGG
ncbi:MAG TPA: pilus assembly protein [Chloroflexi bacterium]|nr:pilus assembly protein [Chloroflexota bacterium]